MSISALSSKKGETMDQNENQMSIADLIEINKMNISILNDWERKFLSDAERTFSYKHILSSKQEACLRRMSEKIFKEIEKAYVFSSHQISHINKLRGLK